MIKILMISQIVSQSNIKKKELIIQMAIVQQFYNQITCGCISAEPVRTHFLTAYSKQLDEVIEPKHNTISFLYFVRDKIDGLGDRLLAYQLLMCFVRKVFVENTIQPSILTVILKKCIEYGSYKDIKHLCGMVRETSFEYEVKERFYKYMVDELIRPQLMKDLNSETPSLLAKWMPRESSEYGWLAVKISKHLFKDIDNARLMRRYRKQNAMLNARLNTTEVHMANKEWHKIKAINFATRLKYERSFHKNDVQLLCKIPEEPVGNWLAQRCNWTPVVDTNSPMDSRMKALILKCPRVLTFSSKPKWIELEKYDCNFEKEEALTEHNGSISFKALEMVPNPVFFSDMTRSEVAALVEREKINVPIVHWNTNPEPYPYIETIVNTYLYGINRLIVETFFKDDLRLMNRQNFFCKTLAQYSS